MSGIYIQHDEKNQIDFFYLNRIETFINMNSVFDLCIGKLDFL